MSLIGNKTLGNMRIDGAGGGDNISSIQTGITGWEDTNTTKDITISEVDLETSIVDFTQAHLNADSARDRAIGIALLDATTIRLYRDGNAELDQYTKLNWRAIEFNNVKSKQSGIYSMASSSFTEEDVTVSSVDTDKSLLYISQNTTNTSTGQGIRYLFSTSRIKNSTTITFYGDAASTIYWQLIEFV